MSATAFPSPPSPSSRGIGGDNNANVLYVCGQVCGGGCGLPVLYDNQHGLWDAMAGFWVTVATRFASTPNVLGYELINEVT